MSTGTRALGPWGGAALAGLLLGCAHLDEPNPAAPSADSRTPTQDLGDQCWGIACLSVANGREAPDHKSELGTQALMGDVVRLLSRGRIWYQAETADGYRAWFEKGTVVRCTREQVEAWNSAPLLVVTALEERILEQPDPAAQPVSDVVICDRVKRLGEKGDWFHVQLPDGRSGYLPKRGATDYWLWKQARYPTAANLERTARLFLGRPYLWGGNSPKGLDCSGLTKLVFYLNGVDLPRNASAQATQGREVVAGRALNRLREGDLLFFGVPARAGRPQRVTHVGIYLGDKLFIHSSERVQISSLDPESTLRDERRIGSLLFGRRVVPEP